MTKRFTVDIDEAIIDNTNKTEYAYWEAKGVEDICDLLNELNEENNRLNTICNHYKQENYELQQKINEAHKTEKQKLIHNLKIAIRTERTEIGRSVLNQLLDQMEYY